MPTYGVVSALQNGAIGPLIAHVLELLLAFKSVKRYPGPSVDSIA